MSEICDRIEFIRGRIAAAAERAGRKPEEVRLLAVSKTFPVSAVQDALASGQIRFGENKVQELEIKVPALSSEIEWHLIGHLQSNKAAKAAALVQWIHSVDSEKLIRKLDAAAGTLNKRLNILLELNLSGEDSKTGIGSETEAFRLAELMLETKNLDFKGLMTMAAVGAEEQETRRTFAHLREIRNRMESSYAVKLPELSMGMSGDFEYAIEEGATIVRVGSSIFGHRTYPDAHT